MTEKNSTYRMSRRTQMKIENRRQIIEAARRVFAERGHQAVSVRDIVRETDLASGTFYNYFNSLDDLIECIAEESQEQFRTTLEELAKSAGTFEEFAHAGFRAFFRYSMNERLELGEGWDVRRVRGASPGAVKVAEEISIYIGEALADKRLDEKQLNRVTAIAIGMARELSASGTFNSIEEADEVAEFASLSLIGAITHLGLES